MTDYFLLFANCLPVKGAKRSTICDLQQDRIKVIPNQLYDVIRLCKSESVADVKKRFANELDEGIDKYFNLLISEGYGFYTQNPNEYPDLSLEWDSPSEITNAIIDVDNRSDHSFKSIVDELSDMGCDALQIRYYDVTSIDDIKHTLKTIHGSRIKSIEIVTPDLPISREEIIKLSEEFMRIRQLLFYGGKNNESIMIESHNLLLLYSNQAIIPDMHCGVVNAQLFTSNIRLFTESQNFNSCLNRKISVDRRGEIKNCPSMSSSFGNVRSQSLRSIVNSSSFRKPWFIKKDEVEVCRDCEFRHVCVDCRVYTKNSETMSKPAKCTYDPYTATWAT